MITRSFKKSMNELDGILTDQVRKAFSEYGSRGGKKTAKRGSEFYREIQKISVQKRKINNKKKHNGEA